MPDGSSIKVSGSVDLVEISKDDIVRNKEQILSHSVPVFRMNIENKLVVVPLDKIEQYVGESSYADSVFYIDKKWNDPVQKTESPKNENVPAPNAQRQKMMEALQKYGDANAQIQKFTHLSVIEREELLDQSIEVLHGLHRDAAKFDIESIVKMVEVVATTFYSNYATTEEASDPDQVDKNPAGIYVKTEWVVRLIIDFFKLNAKTYANYRAIDEIATGSYTIDNISKGVLWFIGFCIFYNDYIDKGLITRRIRVEFKDKHLRYYKSRFPDTNLSVEIVVKDGLRRIEMEHELLLYSMGALLYDIGKLPFINYHDGTDDYDENIVKIHVLTGYNMVNSIKKYPFTVAAMAAFHHEYYGGKGSYNFTNPIIGKLTQKKRTEENAKYFITYNDTEFRDGIALSFFPCKVIEIIDVFNALVHKKAHTPLEALKVMKKNFMAQSLKLDPILFEIFIEFKCDCGILTSQERDEVNSIKY